MTETIDSAQFHQSATFAPVSPAQLETLYQRASVVRLRRGEVLFLEGDLGDTLYVIVRGKVKVGRTSADGRENLIAVLGPGEMLGELSLFDPGPRTGSATAVVPSELYQLSHADFTSWLNDNPAAAHILLRALAQRLRKTNEAMGDLVFSDVPGRVAKALLDLADRFGEPAVGGGTRVAHDLTQEELAQLIGASRETVNKSLADFDARGWLRREGRTLILMDLERLKRRAR